jgi:RNA polymerase sigma-70 factor (ECF subfamily)
MYRRHRDLHSLDETDDVVQKGLIRLNTALRSVQPVNVRAFFGLAARQIRFVVADLAKKYARAKELQSVALRGHTSSRKPEIEDPKKAEPANLLEWSQFHEQIEDLPDEARELFDLLLYEGLSQAEAAVLLAVSERTLRRRWQQARLLLAAALEGEWPRVE